MVDFLITIILVTILGAAVAYIIKAKRRGAKCIGCPDSGNCTQEKLTVSACGGCSGNCRGGCGESTCGCHDEIK